MGTGVGGHTLGLWLVGALGFGPLLYLGQTNILLTGPPFTIELDEDFEWIPDQATVFRTHRGTSKVRRRRTEGHPSPQAGQWLLKVTSHTSADP